MQQISHHITTIILLQPIVRICYIKWPKDDLNNWWYGGFTYIYVTHGIFWMALWDTKERPRCTPACQWDDPLGTCPALLQNCERSPQNFWTWWKIKQAEYPTLLQGGHSCPQEHKDGTNSIGILLIDKYPGIFVKSGNCNCITTFFPAFVFFQGGLDRLYRESKIFVALQAFHQQVEHREA